MDRPVDRSDPRPLHEQVRETLRQEVLGHTLPAGTPLPSEAELQRRFGVARSVVRQALAGLVEDGLVHRGRGRASVATPPTAQRRTVQRAGGLREQFAAAGRELRTTVLDLRPDAPPPQAREALGTADTWRLERLRAADDEPVAVVRAWLPRAVLPGLDAATLGGGSLHALLRAAGHAPVGGPRQVQAVAADERLAGLLAVRPGDPLLLLEGVTCDAEGRGLEWFSTWHRSGTVFDVDAAVDDARPAARRAGVVSPTPDDAAGRLRALVDDLRREVDRLG